MDYRSLFPAGEDSGNKRKLNCWNHDDAHASLVVNLSNGIWKCYACGVTGNARSYITDVLHANPKDYGLGKYVNENDINAYHAALLQNKKALAYWTSTRKVKLNVLKKWRIGYDEETKRTVFPILDDEGHCINLRMYLPNAPKEESKFLNLTGRGTPSLHPIITIKEAEDLVLVAGEPDWLVAISHGLNAITATGGEPTFLKAWADLFVGKNVTVCYDIDDAGIRSAENVAKILFGRARSIRILDLQLGGLLPDKWPNGDLSNYFNDITPNPTTRDFHNLIKATRVWRPDVENVIIDPAEDDTVYDVEFKSVVLAQYGNRCTKFVSHVTGKDKVPYLVPLKLTNLCGEDAGRLCHRCECAGHNGQRTLEMSPHDARLLNLFKCTETIQRANIRDILGIPAACKQHKTIVERHANIEEVHLIRPIGQETDYSGFNNDEYVVRPGYHVFTEEQGMAWNSSYLIEARTVREPKTGFAIPLIYSAKPREDDLSKFVLHDDDVAELKHLFQPSAWTKELIETKWQDIIADISNNVSFIFGRDDIHKATDIVYHSPLGMTWQGKEVRGYVDVLLVGDTRQGKSETVQAYRKHYNLGDKIDCSRATVAGLIGGATEYSDKHWRIEWGVLPLNDRRLVILEEVKNLSLDHINALKELRSSGRAEVVAIKRDSTPARVRCIWIANPRSPRKVCSYSYGIEVIRELIGDPENIARFDFACMVADMESELSRSDLHEYLAKKKDIQHKYTAAWCRKLVKFVWSRPASAVQFTEKAEAAILDISKRLSDKYDDSFPLIQPADFRFKLARVAAACAGRTFSVDKDLNIIIRTAHVEWAETFFEMLYSKVSMGYDIYSADFKRANSLANAEDIKDALLKTSSPDFMVESLVTCNLFNRTQLADWAGIEKDEATRLCHSLLRNRAIASYDASRYKKSPAFNVLLREVQSELLNRKKK